MRIHSEPTREDSVLRDYPSEMTAVVCREPGQLALETRPVPEPGPGEVLVRIRCVGVCGTDMHIYKGKHPFLAYPRVMGHELGGEVAWAPKGSELKAIPSTSCPISPAATASPAAGARPIAARTSICSACTATAAGRSSSRCTRRTSSRPRASASGEAAMVELLAIGAHAVRRGAPGPQAPVLMVGAGPIGMGVMIFAGLTGAEVTALDMRADRLAFCRERLDVPHAVAFGPRTRTSSRRSPGASSSTWCSTPPATFRPWSAGSTSSPTAGPTCWFPSCVTGSPSPTQSSIGEKPRCWAAATRRRKISRR